MMRGVSVLPHVTSLQVYLSFYETRTKSFFFSTRDEKLFWERWCIPIQIKDRASSATGSSRRWDLPREFDDINWTAREEQQIASDSLLRNRLIYIIQMVNEKQDHIPPIPADDKPSLFPVEVQHYHAASTTQLLICSVPM